jgi:DNA helicase-2/ATP-dependent DNA helicase PcrA
MEYNEDQLEVINKLTGAFLVTAPMGTGKTTVLTARVAAALKQGYQPEEILCLTFTNRAAEEMRQRLKVKLDNPEVYNALGIFTFHGFCAYFIRSEAKRLGVDPDFSIADEEDQFSIMSGLLEPEDLIGNERRLALDWVQRLYDARLQALYAELNGAAPIALAPRLVALGEAYQQALAERNILDFNDLVLLAIRGLYQDEQLKEKWSKQYRLIQLDEFQDTHFSEYLVVKQLARHHKNICLVGDFNQTIYGWRGSTPEKVGNLFKQHFAPVTEHSLVTNYRSSHELLQVFERLNTEQSGAWESPALSITAAADSSAEARQIAERVQRLHSQEPTATIAVLVRSNFHVTKIAEQFREQRIAHLTVDQYNFFRRPEVRDVFAYLKLLFNKYDIEAAKRVLQLWNKVPNEVANQISLADCGLRLADFLNFANYRLTEPYAELIQALAKKRIVILDTETTGTDPLQDDIIQIFAIEVVAGEPKRRLEFYLKTNKSVGSSYYIHRLTDAFLQEKGQDPKTCLQEIIEFLGDDLLVGHNLNFDLEVIKNNAERLGLEFKPAHYYDTLDIARRYLSAPNYRLSTLTKYYKLRQATHDAVDDVLGTLDLLKFLTPKLTIGSGQREALFTNFKKYFIKSAADFARWQLLAKSKMPAEILDIILNESGLGDLYRDQPAGPKKLQTLATLKDVFKGLEAPGLAPQLCLRQTLAYSSLAKNIDFLGLEGGKIPIVTIHQVKGLEFDYCILPRLNEGQFPGYKQQDLAEEKRIFYVGLTRARKGISLSYSLIDDYGRPQAPSRFLRYFQDNL